MERYGTTLSRRAEDILEKHRNDGVSFDSVKAFLYDMLGPTADRGDLLYRYEHCVRVGANGAAIAKAEGLPEQHLVIACLLHDVGYRECETPTDFDRHQFVGADIALRYLTNIGYDPAYRDEMVRGIALHNLSDRLPEDMTVFQMSVRDCDDIDRYDVIRTAGVLGDCVFERTNSEIIAACGKAIAKAEFVMSLKRGTKTAREMMDRNCGKRIALLRDVIEQAKKGF